MVEAQKNVIYEPPSLILRLCESPKLAFHIRYNLRIHKDEAG